MKRLLKLLSVKNRFVVTYYEVDSYDIVIVQDVNGNALHIQIINIEF
jgi:uncharacterized membrane protein